MPLVRGKAGGKAAARTDPASTKSVVNAPKVEMAKDFIVET